MKGNIGKNWQNCMNIREKTQKRDNMHLSKISPKIYQKVTYKG